jgi:hypothetical protein
MKKFFLSLLFIIEIISVNKLIAQTGIAINTDGSTADGSAMLDVKATNKGILIPRIALTSSVTTPVTGLLVYQTGGTPGFYYYNGTTWIYIQNSGNTNVTLQGNTFNGVSQLVQLNASSQLPAISGVNVTALNASNLASGTVATARLGTGTANSTTFLSGNNTWAAVGGSSSGYQYNLLTSGATNTITITDITIRTIVGDLNGTSGAATTLNLTLPSAASYPAGASVTFEGSGYTTVLATMNIFSPSSTLSTFNLNNGSMASGVAFTNVSRFQLTSDGVSHWYRIL